MGIEEKKIVQDGLDRKREERLYKIQDSEAIAAVAGKRVRERQQQEAEARRTREEFEAAKRRFQEMEEEERRQEEAHEEELAQRWQDLKGAIPVAAGLCAMGGLYFLGVYNPDVALVAGGLLVMAGLSYGGVAFLRWRSC